MRLLRHSAAVVLAAIAPLAIASGEGADAQLLSAIRSSDYETVESLLKSRRVDPNRVLPDGSTPLSWAVEVQDVRIVSRLLAAKARPDAVTNTAAAPLLLRLRTWGCGHHRAAARCRRRCEAHASRWREARWPCAPVPRPRRCWND